MSMVRFRPEAPLSYLCNSMGTTAGLAHLVERHLAKVEVASSSLVICSIKASTQQSALCTCFLRVESGKILAKRFFLTNLFCLLYNDILYQNGLLYLFCEKISEKCGFPMFCSVKNSGVIFQGFCGNIRNFQKIASCTKKYFLNFVQFFR